MNDADTLYVKYDQILLDRSFKLKHAKPEDVGYDLPVLMDERLKIEPNMPYYLNWDERWFDIPPQGSAEIPCGLSVKLPNNAWGNIKPRSSTGWKRKLSVIEGVIDSGYVGPLFILVHNSNNHTVRINEFDRLAQFIIIPKYAYSSLKIESVDRLPQTERSNTGFGSTSF